MPGQITTGYKLVTTDIGDVSFNLIEKSYLLDLYPGLIPTYKQAGLFVWGFNSYGELGTNDTVSRSSPVQTVSLSANWKYISNGYRSVAAIKTDGTLWLWGENDGGKLGDNTTLNRSSPVQTVSGGTNWKQIALGFSGAASIKTDGTLWTWGKNFFGALGDNTTVARSSPVQVGSGNNWNQVSLTSDTVHAVKADGTLWGWGYSGSEGTIGDNAKITRSSPVQIAGTNWKQVATGTLSTAAIKTDGTLWAWGENISGNLGDGTTSYRSSPVQIGSGTDWKIVRNAVNWYAIKNNGTLWTTGQNFYGNLGDNTTVYRSSPVQTVSSSSDWKYVSPSAYSVSAIKIDGTLWTWGYNDTGELGVNNTLGRSSPVQVGSNYNWKQIPEASYSHKSAIAEFGDF
jgi:alpha-tubulin suppressor-like RCC1 family protein